MLFDKEYPATHSMSTAWYIVDEDGNVGIVECDDNGPALANTVQSCFLDTIFGNQDAKGQQIPVDFTLEQLYEFLKNPRLPQNETELGIDTVVKIKLEKRERFLKLCKKSDIQLGFCYSYEYGFYELDYNYSKKNYLNCKTYKQMISEDLFEMIFTKPEMYLPDIVKEENGIIHNTDTIKNPFYIYCQTDQSIGQYRMSTPKYPVKINQITGEMQNQISKLPLRFSDSKRIEFCEYLPYCEHYVSEYYCARFSYYKKQLNDNSWAYLLDYEFEDKPYPKAIGIFSDNTVGPCFVDSDSLIENDTFYMVYTMGKYWRKADEISYEEKVEKFKKFKYIFEFFIELLKPYFLVIEIESEAIIELFYERTLTTITVNGKVIPCFNQAKVNDYIEDIKHYQSLPYRGEKLPKILRINSND